MAIKENTIDLYYCQNNKLPLFCKQINLLRSLNKIVKYYEAIIAEKGLEFNYENNIEKNDENKIWAFTDESRVEQIFDNLLSNSIKFTQKGNIKLSINLEKESEDEYLQVRINDTGCGIGDYDQGKNFHMFGKLKRDCEEDILKGSIGFGLQLSSLLVKLLSENRGSLVINSKVSEGTEFIFPIYLNDINEIKLLVPDEQNISNNIKKYEYSETKGVLKLNNAEDREMRINKVLLLLDDRPEGLTIKLSLDRMGVRINHETILVNSEIGLSEVFLKGKLLNFDFLLIYDNILIANKSLIKSLLNFRNQNLEIKRTKISLIVINTENFDSAEVPFEVDHVIDIKLKESEFNERLKKIFD